MRKHLECGGAIIRLRDRNYRCTKCGERGALQFTFVDTGRTNYLHLAPPTEKTKQYCETYEMYMYDAKYVCKDCKHKEYCEDKVE